MSSEADGKAAQPQESSGGFKNSPLGKIIFGKDDDSRMALFQMGLSMMQPQQAGTNFGQNAVNSIGSGFNYLQRLESARNQAGIGQQQANTNEMTAEAQAQLAEDTAANIDRRGDQIDMENALRLYGSNIEAEKNAGLWAVARSKINDEKDERKTKLMEGLLDIEKAHVEAGNPMDAERFMSMYNLIESGWKPDKIIFDPQKQQFIVSSASLDGYDDEGNRAPQFKVISPREVAAFGGDASKIAEFYTNQARKQAKEPLVDPELAKQFPSGAYQVGNEEFPVPEAAVGMDAQGVATLIGDVRTAMLKAEQSGMKYMENPKGSGFARLLHPGYQDLDNQKAELQAYFKYLQGQQ